MKFAKVDNIRGIVLFLTYKIYRGPSERKKKYSYCNILTLYNTKKHFYMVDEHAKGWRYVYPNTSLPSIYSLIVGIISYTSPLYLHFTIIRRILTSMNNTFCGHLSRHFNDMKKI